MNKKTSKNHNNKSPFYQDELDVYEAVWKIGQKRGKTILTKDQIAMLEDAGRIKVGGVKKLGSKKKTAKSKRTNEQRVRLAFKTVELMLKRVDQYKDKLFSEKAWKAFDGEEKERAREQLFIHVYGKSTEDVGYDIYKGIE